MAKKTVAKKDIALPLKYYEGNEPSEEELAYYALVLKSINASHGNLLKVEPFIGNLLMNLTFVIDTTIPTAATDFRNVYVNPTFWAKLDPGERLFTLAHETWHVAMSHSNRRQTRFPEPWNVACDLEIHFILQNETKIKEPWCLPHDPSWSTWSAEQIYDAITKGKGKDPGGNGTNPGGNGTNPGGWWIPVHSGNDPGKQNDHFGPNDQPFDGVIYDDNSSNAQEGDDGKVVSRKGDWSPASEKSESIDDFTSRVIREAAEAARKSHGTIPGAVSDIIDELDNPVIPWREKLSVWANKVTSSSGRRCYARLSRRTWSLGAILPTREDVSLRIVVAIDTSGSCDDEIVREFFSELAGIMDAFEEYEITVIQCDSRVRRVDKFTNDEPYDPSKGFEIEGRGGTNFQPVFDYVEENELNPTALVYLTDGWADEPNEPDYPVLWVITQGGKRPCSWGEATSMTNDRVE